MSNSDIPAMPVSVAMGPQGEFMTSEDYGYSGLTKLEDFTKAAMQGLLSNLHAIEQLSTKELADEALLAAKSQLAALEKG